MVAKITTPLSIRRALNYNEQKVLQGKATCLQAVNFLKEAYLMNFYQKLERFERQISLNERARTNTVHISLNFDNTDQLDREKLLSIAREYMEKIGFKEQPYLIYQHLDAGHPHVHIVTTNIQKDGKRIDTYNIGRNQSVKAKNELEQKYGLVKAEKKAKEARPGVALPAQKVTYGKSETKRSITNVLDAVLNTYRFSSLAELNAVLRQYNVVADRGNEQRIIYNKKGLVYRVLDEKGAKIGVPIKASSIYSKPTLNQLEALFKVNETLKQDHKRSLKTTLDWILIRPPKGLQAFKEALQKEKVTLVIRQNESGIIYGLTYIDHRSKCVFNGSDLGKDYSAKAILEKCGQTQLLPSLESTLKLKTSDPIEQGADHSKNKGIRENQILTALTAPELTPDYIPYELKKAKRRKHL